MLNCFVYELDKMSYLVTSILWFLLSGCEEYSVAAAFCDESV